MTRVHRMSIVAAMILVTSTAVFADPITILSAQRHAIVGPFIFSDSPTPTAAEADGATLVATVTMPVGASPATGTATLASRVADPMHWSGTGSAATSWTAPADIEAGAFMIVDFLVTSPVTYAFEGDLASTSADAFDTSQAGTGASLSVFTGIVDRDNEEIFRPLFSLGTESSATHSDAVNRAFAGLLAPGKYQFMVDANSTGFASLPSRATGGSSEGHFSFALDFTPAAVSATPEPASLLLLGTGIAGLFGVRARGSSRSR
jgi:hypothetical protein